jgi:hypothetical protein
MMQTAQSGLGDCYIEISMAPGRLHTNGNHDRCTAAQRKRWAGEIVDVVRRVIEDLSPPANLRQGQITGSTSTTLAVMFRGAHLSNELLCNLPEQLLKFL